MNSARPSYTFDISLRLWHPSMTAEEISSRLSLASTVQWDVGSFSGAGRPREATYWSHRLAESQTGSIAIFIERYVEWLGPRGRFLNEVRMTGGRVEFFVGLFLDGSAGELFSWKLLRALGEAHIDLALDVYDSTSGARRET
jgi:hypothetical protein